ncbi:MAG: hypothetical protein H6945_15165 [Zoogloeaceae bacterium]|nr:hypothetical protein [Rhodocyclaceae bacterium]MCP5237075.1 hypothetical protein [Zoogloeaceae bacterium]
MSATFAMPVGDPVFAGHFPDQPIVPGAWLLDHVVEAATASGLTGPWRLATVKFLSPVGPGEAVTLALQPARAGGLGFTLQHGERVVASGRIEGLEG